MSKISAGDLLGGQSFGRAFSSQSVLTVLESDALRRQSNSHTTLFLLDRTFYTVLGWGGSESRCLLLACPEMPHLHEEGLVSIATTRLMATVLSMEAVAT